MKPEFFKPFNLEHAKAGAPYGCKEGQHGEVLKWDANHQRYPLIGIICEHDYHYPESWTASGVQASDDELQRRPGRDLVMLPLGLIDGKPIFVGDKIVGTDGSKFIAEPSDQNGDIATWRWPEPEKDYPKSAMSADEMAEVWNQELTHELGHMALANAVLRHAIDNSQVVAISKAKPGIRPHNPYTGALRDQRDIDSDPMGILIRHVDEPVKADTRAERDMAIANAVRTAALIAHPIARGCEASEDRNELWSRIREIDLEAIIHSIK